MMMERDAASNPSRVDARRVGDKDDTTHPPPAPSRAANLAHGKMQRDLDSGPSPSGHEQRTFAPDDATSSPRVTRPVANSTRRDPAPASSSSTTTTTTTPDSSSRATPLPGTQPPPTDGQDTSSSRRQQQQQQARQHPPRSGSNSQDTASTNDTDTVFTPPASESGMSPDHGSAQDSSQESHLLQLSQVAAVQDRIPDAAVDASENGPSRKRMADGVVKHTRNKSSTSPGRMGHSRNTSTVSIASTAGSRMGELSAELKARLSYAMVKVNNGWQGHSIDQVETLASHAGSPVSSNSTIHLRNGSSASPQLSNGSHRGSNNTTPATGLSQQFSVRPHDPVWRESVRDAPRGSPASPVRTTPSLAPPVSIQPSRHLANPRRNSNPKLTPTFLAGAHLSPNPGPNTPGQPSPYMGTAQQRSPLVDPILFSPHQNVREKDAIESLLFMSSPGNSANLKHAFPSSSQPLPSGHNGPQRTALPTGQPRKSLPSGRPIHHVRSQSQTQKRVGFEKSPNEMDVDEPYGTPHSRGTPRRKVNGSGAFGQGDGYVQAARLKQLPASSGLTVTAKPRPALKEEDIDRMLDSAAADDSESDGEIQIPVSRARRDGARVGA